MTSTRRLVLSLASLTLCAPIVACSDEAGVSSIQEESVDMDMAVGGTAGRAFPAAPPAPPPTALDREHAAIGFAAAPAADAQAEAPLPQILPVGSADSTRSMIIRTGESRIQVDSLEASVAAVERAAAALGGWVSHSSLQLGEEQWRTARLEVKIPADRWEGLIAGLERIGELRQLTTATEDVGEQFVDLTAQLANARRLEERYLQLLENRTGTLEDLLAVERELARVRERIERTQGRLRYLGERVAVSTMVVNLEEATALLATGPDSEPIRDALRAAWRNFLGVITGGIALLGVVVPVGALLALALWGWRRARRRRRRAME
jgi:hypothetical protein